MPQRGLRGAVSGCLGSFLRTALVFLGPFVLLLPLCALSLRGHTISEHYFCLLIELYLYKGQPLPRAGHTRDTLLVTRTNTTEDTSRSSLHHHHRHHLLTTMPPPVMPFSDSHPNSSMCVPAATMTRASRAKPSRSSSSARSSRSVPSSGAVSCVSLPCALAFSDRVLARRPHRALLVGAACLALPTSR